MAEFFKSTLHILDNIRYVFGKYFFPCWLDFSREMFVFFFMKIKIFLDSSCVIYVQMLFCHSWAIIYQHFYMFLQFGAH